MANKAKVYMPTGKLEDYLPYFDRVDDPNFDDTFYLVKEIKIDPDSVLGCVALQQVEQEYNLGDSKKRELFEDCGIKFEYVLNVNQTSSYKLIIDEAAKEFLSNAMLHIGSMDGEFTELYIIFAAGCPYGSYDVLDALTGEGKEFLQMLIKKKLLKKKTIQLETFDINEIRIDDNK